MLEKEKSKASIILNTKIPARVRTKGQWEAGVVYTNRHRHVTHTLFQHYILVTAPSCLSSHFYLSCAACTVCMA